MPAEIAQLIILYFSVHLSNLVSLDAQVQKRRVTILTLPLPCKKLIWEKMNLDEVLEM